MNNINSAFLETKANNRLNALRLALNGSLWQYNQFCVP